jgi:hypothetical protein
MDLQPMETATKAVTRALKEVDLEPLLDERDVAEITRRSLASVRRDRQLRKGVPFIRIGSSIRYRPQSLREFLGSCETSGVPQAEAR